MRFFHQQVRLRGAAMKDISLGNEFMLSNTKSESLTFLVQK